MTKIIVFLINIILSITPENKSNNKETNKNQINYKNLRRPKKQPVYNTFNWNDPLRYARLNDDYQDDIDWDNRSYESRWGNYDLLYDQLQLPNNFEQYLLASSPVVDPFFPPNKNTLWDDAAIKGLDDKNWIAMYVDPKNLSFKRPNEIFPNGYTFLNGLSSGQINQGSNGDCYLMVVLAALSRFPERIFRIFNTKRIHRSGIYSLNMFVDGVPQRVFVDDYLVYDEAEKKLAFAFNKSNDIWVNIYEKAYAKVHITYNNIDGGIEGETFREITGFPYRHYLNKKTDTYHKYDFETLYHAYTKKFPIFTGSNSEKYNGTTDKHAYAVMHVIEVDGIRLLQVKNPWGEFEIPSKYSDHSPVWTPTFKAKVESYIGKSIHFEDDGLFFIEFSEFTTHFDDLTIGLYMPNALYTFHKLKDKNVHWFKINIKYPQDIAIMVTLTNERTERAFRKNTKYQYNFLFWGNGFYHKFNYSDEYYNDIYIENIPKGDYFFGIRLLNCDNCDFDSHRFVMGMWGYSYSLTEITNEYLRLGENIFKLCATNYYRYMNNKTDGDLLYNRGDLKDHKNYCSYLQ